MARVFTHISDEEQKSIDPKSPLGKRLAALFSEQQGKQWQHYAEVAHEQYHRDGEIEIDTDDCCVSVSDDNGAYVQAWVWVDDVCCPYCDEPLRPFQKCEKAGCQE